MVSNRDRLMVLGLAAVLVLSGFAFGRWSRSDKAEAITTESKPVAAAPTPEAVVETAGAEAQAFYLSDYKTGYSDGYEAGASGQGSALATTTRLGYNDGFKEGFADGYQARANGAEAAPVAYSRTTARPVARQVVYRERPVFVERKKNSKLKTALTIAAPAAIAAGVGGAFAGKKGAGVGALLGGGGGALYHLIKNR